MPVIACTAQADKAPPVTYADRQFLDRFERCVLPESEWTHLAHIRIAWICLALESPGAALQRLRRGILSYNTRVLGRPERYHETVTAAFAAIIASRKRTGEPWQAFAGRIDDLLDRASPILLRYYSPGRLSSEAARRAFLPADLRALPEFPGTGAGQAD